MNDCHSRSEEVERLSRRSFLKASAAVSGGAAAFLSGVTPFKQPISEGRAALAQEEEPADEFEEAEGWSDVEAEAGTFIRARDFPIVPWDAWALVNAGEKELAKSMRQCGFNLLFTDVDGVDVARRLGLKAIVRDGSTNAKQNLHLPVAEIRRRVRALVRRVSEEPSQYNVFGYFLVDEPYLEQIPLLKPWVEAFKEMAPNALRYINLFPGSKQEIGWDKYEEYLETYVRELDPTFISYDFYAFWEDGSIWDRYFWQLETVSRVASRHNLPFWNTVLSNAHGHYAEPSEALLRHQLFTTLAYGARGISWFTYQTPTYMNFRLAPIDQFGNKTPTWDMLRRVNNQFHQLASVYLTLKPVNVFHFPEQPLGTSGIETSVHVEKISRFVAFGHIPINACVGEFEGPNGEPYVLIVNTDIKNSAEFTIKFKEAQSEADDIYWVNSYTGQIELMPRGPYLAPGQGMLLTPRPW